MPGVSTAYRELANLPKPGLAEVFAAGTPPEVPALTGYEYRGFNQPKSTALLGIRTFIKAFYLDRSGHPFGCNTPVARNALDGEWIARPTPDHPRRYAFFLVEPPDPDAPDPERRTAALLDYGRGANPARDPSRLLRDYVVRVEPGSDDLLLGKAYITIAGTRIAHTYFLIERYRPLPDPEALANR